MKKVAYLILAIVAISCGASQQNSGSPAGKKLYEVLTRQSDGGASIQFYEILTEKKEIEMLMSDENLRGKITSEDLVNANFVILNMGEKPTGGHFITVDKVEESDNLIIVSVKENGPGPGMMTTQAITYPYTVIKINSKKQIVIK